MYKRADLDKRSLEYMAGFFRKFKGNVKNV